MSLENGNYIKDLQPLNPPGTDPVSEGNDHLKLIKKVLKNSFPSDIEAPMIPDIDGNDGQFLKVKEDGSGTEWTSVDLSSLRVKGQLSRSRFEYVGANEIKIYPGTYDLGAKGYTVTWDTPLNITGIGGDPSAWSYIYIDESEIAERTVTEAEIRVSTDAPVWSDASHGWYDDLDRCIFAVRNNSEGGIYKFFHSGSDYVSFSDDYTELSYTPAVIDSWTTIPLSAIPSFSSEAELTWHLDTNGPVTNSCAWSWRTTESNAEFGHFMGTTEGGGGQYADEHVVANTRAYVATSPTDTEKSVDYYADSKVSGHELELHTNGFYLPGGI